MSAPSTSPKGYATIIALGAFLIALASVYDFASQAGHTISLPNIKIGGVVTQGHEYYKVLRVVDGDTIEVDLRGTPEKVRLIGINTPETVDPRKPVQCFGKEASDRMKELADGKNVYLEYDDTQTLRDIYGRLLAYVYLEDGEMLNRKMIAEGYAYEYTYMTAYKYQADFKSAQTIAKENKRGLWADDTCAGNE